MEPRVYNRHALERLDLDFPPSSGPKLGNLNRIWNVHTDMFSRAVKLELTTLACFPVFRPNYGTLVAPPSGIGGKFYLGVNRTYVGEVIARMTVVSRVGQGGNVTFLLVNRAGTTGWPPCWIVRSLMDTIEGYVEDDADIIPLPALVQKILAMYPFGDRGPFLNFQTDGGFYMHGRGNRSIPW